MPSEPHPAPGAGIPPFALPEEPLERLARFDPDLAALVSRHLARGQRALLPAGLDRLVDEIMWAATVSLALARTLAAGGAELLVHADTERIGVYWPEVRRAAAHGPELGQIMAAALAPVLCFGSPPGTARFLSAVAVLRAKGTYTLKRPLQALEQLLRDQDREAARTFVDLIRDAFDQPLTYNQSLHLTHSLPKAALNLKPPRRAFQLDQIRRIAMQDVVLVDDFIDGLAAGLEILDAKALACFVDEALACCQRQYQFGRRMLALRTESARHRFRSLQQAVSLAEVRPALGRYLAARLGRHLAVRPLSELGAARRISTAKEPAVCSDGSSLYLPAEMDAGAGRAANVDLYKLLVRLEAGYYEYGTLDFDLERMTGAPAAIHDEPDDLCDLERLFGRFGIPQLAEDLFTIAEHGRLMRTWRRDAPGLWRLLKSRLAQPAPASEASRSSILCRLYRGVVLGRIQARASLNGPPLEHLFSAFERQMAADPSVEGAAGWTMTAYAALVSNGDRLWDAEPLHPPYGWRVPAALFGQAQRTILRRAAALKRGLASHGAQIYRSALIRELIRSQGRLESDQVASLLRQTVNRRPGTPTMVLDPQTLRRLLETATLTSPDAVCDGTPAAWYPEWDQAAGGYLADHVRVVDRPVAPGDPAFYPSVLTDRPGLVVRLRRTFEWLRPQGIGILRQWIEGDEFDYRALIDYAVDRQAGVTPSERLYIKRVKRLRDVAVLLLVDLSRSTGNLVAGSRQRVVDVEKEAIVLFCEALGVVGDRFALAGFSGSGRLGVEYLRIKEFDAPVDGAVKERIASVAPRRATRMGAAIRHAVMQLAAQPVRVRLLLILGDGFPNDIDYKADHAVADTRQAMGEARARGIYTHAITVNLPQDARLDDLYGPVRHTVIGDVTELPGKLLGIYGRLTR